MENIKSVIHFYRVESLEKAKLFYQEILGFKLIKDQGKCLIFDAQGYGSIGFCTHFPLETNQSTCITLVLGTKTEVDAMYHHMRKHVSMIEKPIVSDYFNIYHFFLKDFNNLTLEIQCFL